MKENDLKPEDVEVSHTLGGTGESRSCRGRGKWRVVNRYTIVIVNRSRRNHHMGKGSVAKKPYQSLCVSR